MVRPSRPLSTLITICLPFLAIATADAQTHLPFKTGGRRERREPQDGWAAGTPRTVTGGSPSWRSTISRIDGPTSCISSVTNVPANRFSSDSNDPRWLPRLPV